MLLELIDVSKQQADQQPLHGLSLCIDVGEVVAIYASSGQDSELLFELLSGRTLPTSGVITLLGSPLDAKCIPVMSVGYLDKLGQAYERLRVMEYLELFAGLYGTPRAYVQELAGKVGLTDRLRHPIKALTPDFLARLNVARTCIHKPQLLILQNPSAGLDIDSTEILRHFILSEVKRGAGVLIISNSLEEVEALGKRTYRLTRGNLTEIVRHDESADTEPPTARFSARRIAARVEERTLLFDPTEIIYASSQEGVSSLYYEGGNAPCPLTLAELEKRLTPFGFFRCHRSYLVNLQRVREVVPWTRSSFSLILDDNSKSTIPMSKNAAKELEDILGLKDNT